MTDHDRPLKGLAAGPALAGAHDLGRAPALLPRDPRPVRAPAAGGRRWGMLRLTTIGPPAGRRRVAILGYLEDGPNLVIPAMNGWADPEPAWWLNLQARPKATRRAARRQPSRGDRPRRGGRGAGRAVGRFVDLGTLAYTDANAALRAGRRRSSSSSRSIVTG